MTKELAHPGLASSGESPRVLIPGCSAAGRGSAIGTPPAAHLDWRRLTIQCCTADRIQMTTTTGASETWQARITHELAAQLRDDAELLGLNGRTEIVKAALELLHKRAAEERMARSVDSFYAGREPALPIGVRPERRSADVDVPA